MKKALLVIASLLAVSSVMAAMAFSSATVKNDANFTIQNTSESLLAMKAGDHEAAYYEEANDGAEVLVIDFDKGKDGQEFGLQPNSEYTWLDLFSITNNSENPVDLTIDFAPTGDGPDLADARLEVKVNTGNGWVAIDGTNELKINGVAPGEMENIDVQIIQNHPDQDGASDGNPDSIKEFQIVVSAETQQE
ncbi:hypothetical protein [Chengkuizengella axinellae]|uniref:DUF1102 domain-containing protein n=1 Tax=Chengkuizengella axinellae TaxID=3064388 RepID=A0ABT9IYF0_9BACL|nr:hypothetical protein [Chengkuizengella sp. 2205SS18-9]MDP5274384.1 hypothetical protein [Chengkuizengella sp. 2205SS18-9]